jgi:hypothetical protein
MSVKILSFEEFLAKFKDPSYRTAPKYNSTNELKIAHAWWAIDKKGIEMRLKECTQLVFEALKDTPKHDIELNHLHGTASRLCPVRRSRPIKVALIGAQGAGKSLLINALFETDGLSLTGADGAACTSSITRYTQYPGGDGDNEEKKYSAEVRFLDAKKIEAMLAEHARCYAYYQNDEEDSGDEASPIKSRQTDEIDRRAKDTAEDIFHTIFGSSENFLESWNLADHASGEFASICQLKCNEALSKLNTTSQGVATYIGRDQQDLLRQIKPFLTAVPGTTCLWPLVDSVSIRLGHNILKESIEVIDLPGRLSETMFRRFTDNIAGWGDINLSRVRHAEDIKDSVDVEIILTDTIRIASDDAVINTARSAVALRGAPNVLLVATKIDVSP